MSKEDLFRQDFLADFSDSSLLDELRRVAGLAPNQPLTTGLFELQGNVSPNTIIRRFGGWKKALKLAGLADRNYRAMVIERKRDERRQYYIKLLRNAAIAKNADSISMADFEMYSISVSAEMVCNIFGNWMTALQAAGLSIKRVGKFAYTREECLANLKAYVKATGHLPSYDQLQGPPSVIGTKAYERIWGKNGYSKALKEFSDILSQEGSPLPKGIINPRTLALGLTDEELRTELFRIAGKVGDVVTKADVLKHSHVAYNTFVRRLGGGSWAKALKSIDLDCSRQALKFTDEDYFNNLMQIWERLGRRPLNRDMDEKPSTVSSSGYENRFGSWKKALLAFLNWVNLPEDEREIAENKNDLVTKPISVSNSQRVVNGPVADRSTRIVRRQNEKRRFAGPRLRFLVFQRDHRRCVYCGAKQSENCMLVVDHKLAWAKGGRTVLENLQTLCETCNSGKGDLALD